MTFTDLPGNTTRKDFTQFVHGNGAIVISFESYDRLYQANCIDGMGLEVWGGDEGDVCMGVDCTLTAKAQAFANHLAS